MTPTACADPFFGLNGQSLAVLALLAQTPPRFADFNPETGYDVVIDTFPWFNSREKGVCVSIRLKGGKFCRIIAFGEDRASDAIFVEHWDQKVPVNAPTIEEREEYVWDDVARLTFDRGRLDLTVTHIVEAMAEFYNEQKHYTDRTRPVFSLVQG